jgi:ATP/ADP translocase
MKLITYYIVLSTVGDVIAAFVCLGIEKVVPWISMPIFLALFFLILWAAWIAAVKMTEPKLASEPIVGATSDQRA